MLLYVELWALNPVGKDYFKQFYPVMLYIAAFCNSLLSTKSSNCCMYLGSIPLYSSREWNGSLSICSNLAVKLKWLSQTPKHLKNNCARLWPWRVSVTSTVWFTHRKLIFGDWSDFFIFMPFILQQRSFRWIINHSIAMDALHIVSGTFMVYKKMDGWKDGKNEKRVIDW